jgi:UDP-N-acetylglucosamine 2-epimerase (non-hydrolysing)
LGKNRKILIGFGTRPELIKVYPLYLFLLKKKNIDCQLIFTNQHDILINNLIKKLKIKIDYRLTSKFSKFERSIKNFIGKSLINLEKTLKNKNFDLVIAQGDTSTTYILALFSHLSKIPFAHLEAGLRTYDNYNPYPEESFRQMISRISDYHFCPTKSNYKNLINEKINKNKIFITGNTSIDFLKIQKIKKSKNLSKKVLITIHRRENIGKYIKSFVSQLLSAYNDFEFIHVKHANPIFHDYFKNIKFDNYKIIEPKEYTDFIKFIQNFDLIISDSGGLQEECITLKIPLIVYREKTERTEGLIYNFIRLSKPSKFTLVKHFKLFNDLNNKNGFNYPKLNPYGNGDASKKIYDSFAKIWNL